MRVGGAQRTLYNIVSGLSDFEHIIITYAIDAANSEKIAALSNVKCVVVSHWRKIFMVLKEQYYDVVHYHWWPQMDIWYTFFKNQHKPIIVTLQEQCSPPEYNDVYYIAGSNNNLQYISHMKNKQVIYLGVDTNSIVEKQEDNNKTLLVIGRVSTIIESKIPEDLFEVFSGMEISSKKLLFFVCGTGDAEFIDYLEKEKMNYPNLNLIINTEPYVADKYSKMDYFVYWLPEGSTESFGLVIVEAMFSGVPVIAQRLGAIPEIIEHGESGFLFDEPTEIQLYIKKMEEDSVIRNTIIQNAKQRAAKMFSSDIMIKNYRNLYEKVFSIR